MLRVLFSIYFASCVFLAVLFLSFFCSTQIIIVVECCMWLVGLDFFLFLISTGWVVGAFFLAVRFWICLLLDIFFLVGI